MFYIDEPGCSGYWLAHLCSILQMWLERPARGCCDGREQYFWSTNAMCCLSVNWTTYGKKDHTENEYQTEPKDAHQLVFRSNTMCCCQSKFKNQHVSWYVFFRSPLTIEITLNSNNFTLFEDEKLSLVPSPFSTVHTVSWLVVYNNNNMMIIAATTTTIKMASVGFVNCI